MLRFALRVAIFRGELAKIACTDGHRRHRRHAPGVPLVADWATYITSISLSEKSDK